jgi:predicted aspartyl protease
VGTFEITVRVANPASPSRSEAVSLLVDTGATLSRIPREILARIGVSPVSQFTFQLADGRKIERNVGGVMMAIDGRSLPIPVAFSETGKEQC